MRASEEAGSLTLGLPVWAEFPEPSLAPRQHCHLPPRNTKGSGNNPKKGYQCGPTTTGHPQRGLFVRPLRPSQDPGATRKAPRV